jgi:hypothetical protein
LRAISAAVRAKEQLADRRALEVIRPSLKGRELG